MRFWQYIRAATLSATLLAIMVVAAHGTPGDLNLAAYMLGSLALSEAVQYIIRKYHRAH